MFFDTKLLVILVFVIINLLIISIIKTRTSTIISLIISHLILVLFLSLSISSYNSFKEVVLALVAYSMVALFLISNYNSFFLKEKSYLQASSRIKKLIIIPAIIFVVSTISFSLFLVSKNISNISNLVSDKKIDAQNAFISDPLSSPSHPVHKEIQKHYLGKKLEDQADWLEKSKIEFEVDENKWIQLKEKLSENFLLKRSSDVILIIVAISTTLLLLSNKKSKIKS